MELHGDDANASTASPDGTTPVKKTPAKRKSSTPAKGKAAAAATDSGDDANAPPASSEATATPAKKTPTKRKASTPAKGKGAAAATATDSGDADSKPAAEPKQETGAGAVVGDGHGAGAEDAAASPPATGGGTVEENPKKRQRTKKGIARKVTKKTQEYVLPFLPLPFACLSCPALSWPSPFRRLFFFLLSRLTDT